MIAPQALYENRGSRAGSHVYSTNDGFFYHENRRANGTIYYRCSGRRDGCPSTAKLVNGVFYLMEPHNHAGNIGRADYQSARFQLVDQFRDLNVTSVEAIFTNPRNLHLQQQFPQLTSRLLYPSMLRAREGVLPRIQTILELSEMLQDPRLTASCSNHDTLYRGSVQCEDGSCIIIMLSQRCQEFFEMIPCVFLVSTEICVNVTHCCKVITIACEWDRDIIELAWFLTENDVSVVSLVRAFTFMKSCLRSCRVTEAICGMSRIAEAFSTSFEVNVSHSFFDFIQWMKDRSPPTQSDCLKNIIKLTSALPMLPRDLLQGGIEQIVNEAQRTGVINDCLPLFNQIETDWFTLPHFSVFGSSLRANFGIEDFKHKLQRKFSNVTDLFGIVRKIKLRWEKSLQKVQYAINGQKFQPKMPLSIGTDPDVLNINSNSVSVELKIWNMLNIVRQKISHVI